MTDDLTTYGLGALPDPPDERDYSVSALYASEGLVASVVLPTRYAAPGMPAVLDQHATPMCVAYSSSAMKAWQDRRDQARFFDFDEPRFFAEIGGTAAGAYVRAAMERMRTAGYPVTGSGDPGHHRIAAYYTVPRDLAAIKAAIHDLGPIVVSTPWYRSWFHPIAGVLPKPDTWSAGTRSSPTAGTPGACACATAGARDWGDRRRLLAAGFARPAPLRRLEGRRRDRAPDPIGPHGRGHRTAQPQRPEGARRPRRPRSARSPTGATWPPRASRSTAGSTR